MQPSESREPQEPQESSRPAHPGPDLSHPRRRPPILATIAALVVVCLFVALLGVRAAGSDLVIPFFGASAPTGPAAPANWQTYHDPAGLFSVRLPPTWTVRFATSTDNYGDPTGSATETDESIKISDPAQGDASPWVSVNASPIHTAFEHHWYCQAFPGKHDSFHGIAAESMNYGVTWLFETGNAHFQIDYGILGVKGPAIVGPLILTPVPTPTPLQPSTVTADQTLVDTILASFQPTNPHALACS